MYVLIYYSSFLKEQEQGTISTMDNIQRQEKESGAFGENGRVSNVTINSDDIVPTVFKWDNGGRNVYITGTFNNWERQIPMHRSGNEFSYVHNLSRGKHAYKFIVDDEWRFAPDQPTVADVEGRINNFIDVSEFSPYIGDASKYLSRIIFLHITSLCMFMFMSMSMYMFMFIIIFRVLRKK